MQSCTYLRLFGQENMLGFTFETNIFECSFGTPIFGRWGEGVVVH